MNKNKSLTALLLLFAWQVAAAQLTEGQADTHAAARAVEKTAAADKAPAALPDKSYLIPALEVISFDLLLSGFNRRFSGIDDYNVSSRSIRANLRGPWVVDNDPFMINQAAHPYQGSLYHAAGRATGLNYWEASALTFAGSAWWEITGEQTKPSINDQVASGIAGSFLGEPLFRMAKLVQDRSNLPYTARRWLAAVISPSVGLNQIMFGSRFDNSFSDHDPEYYGRLHLGVTRATTNDFDTTPDFRKNAAQADFSLDYGMPGKPGYTYNRPFDYFSFHGLISTANGVENLNTRGLLIGTDYAAGDNYRGIWGLYANYDYLSPQIFSLSTTSLSVGTTGQWWLSQNIALQGTGLAGFGYAAASTARVSTELPEYHYGTAPRVGLSLRLIADKRASIDVSAMMVSLGSVARRNAGRDDISRVDTAFTWRVSGPHAVGINYVWSHRSSDYPGNITRTQSLGRVGIFYTLLGQDGFGAVDWRANSL